MCDFEDSVILTTVHLLGSKAQSSGVAGECVDTKLVAKV